MLETLPTTYHEATQAWFRARHAQLDTEHQILELLRHNLDLERRLWEMTQIAPVPPPTPEAITVPSVAPSPDAAPPPAPLPESDGGPALDDPAPSKLFGGRVKVREGAITKAPAPPSYASEFGVALDSRNRPEVEAAATLYLERYPQATYYALGKSLGILPRTVARIDQLRKAGQPLSNPPGKRKPPLPTLYQQLPADDPLRDNYALGPYHIDNGGPVEFEKPE